MRFDVTRGEWPSDATYDVCIIGAGAAGITLARKMAAGGKRVVVCEGGQLDFTDASQDIYKGRVVGDPYFELEDCRLRYFGGSTNHWGGMARMFDDVDFDRGYLGPEFVWPIGPEAIRPYLQEACDIIEIDPDFNDETVDDATGLRRIDIRFSPPVNFAEKYLDTLTGAQAVDLLLGANFVDLGGGAAVADHAVVADFNGRRHTVRAGRFVFAMGGIENSRLLLWLRELHGNRFFDGALPVGRYWMEHPHFKLGEALVETSVEQGEYYALPASAQKDLGVLNARFELDRQGSNRTRRLANEVLCVAPRLGARLLALLDKDLICGVRLRSSWEQAPDPANRVALDTGRDRFDIPQVALYWRKSALDRHTISASYPVFNRWLLDSDLGRLRLDDWLVNGEEFPGNDDFGGNHHIGGTRMGTRRDLSVVDENCRIHGSPNLYVAGSSVFVTGGHANPTLPLLQFTLRLADHLLA